MWRVTGDNEESHVGNLSAAVTNDDTSSSESSALAGANISPAFLTPPTTKYTRRLSSTPQQFLDSFYQAPQTAWQYYWYQQHRPLSPIATQEEVNGIDRSIETGIMSMLTEVKQNNDKEENNPSPDKISTEQQAESSDNEGENNKSLILPDSTTSANDAILADTSLSKSPQKKATKAVQIERHNTSGLVHCPEAADKDLPVPHDSTRLIPKGSIPRDPASFTAPDNYNAIRDATEEDELPDHDPPWEVSQCKEVNGRLVCIPEFAFRYQLKGTERIEWLWLSTPVSEGGEQAFVLGKRDPRLGPTSEEGLILTHFKAGTRVFINIPQMNVCEATGFVTDAEPLACGGKFYQQVQLEDWPDNYEGEIPDLEQLSCVFWPVENLIEIHDYSRSQTQLIVRPQRAGNSWKITDFAKMTYGGCAFPYHKKYYILTALNQEEDYVLGDRCTAKGVRSVKKGQSIMVKIENLDDKKDVKTKRTLQTLDAVLKDKCIQDAHQKRKQATESGKSNKASLEKQTKACSNAIKNRIFMEQRNLTKADGAKKKHAVPTNASSKVKGAIRRSNESQTGGKKSKTDSVDRKVSGGGRQEKHEGHGAPRPRFVGRRPRRKAVEARPSASTEKDLRNEETMDDAQLTDTEVVETNKDDDQEKARSVVGIMDDASVSPSVESNEFTDLGRANQEVKQLSVKLEFSRQRNQRLRAQLAEKKEEPGFAKQSVGRLNIHAGALQETWNKLDGYRTELERERDSDMHTSQAVSTSADQLHALLKQFGDHFPNHPEPIDRGAEQIVKVRMKDIVGISNMLATKVWDGTPVIKIEHLRETQQYQQVADSTHQKFMFTEDGGEMVCSRVEVSDEEIDKFIASRKLRVVDLRKPMVTDGDTNEEKTKKVPQTLSMQQGATPERAPVKQTEADESANARAPATVSPLMSLQLNDSFGDEPNGVDPVLTQAALSQPVSTDDSLLDNLLNVDNESDETRRDEYGLGDELDDVKEQIDHFDPTTTQALMTASPNPHALFGKDPHGCWLPGYFPRIAREQALQLYAKYYVGQRSQKDFRDQIKDMYNDLRPGGKWSEMEPDDEWLNCGIVLHRLLDCSEAGGKLLTSDEDLEAIRWITYSRYEFNWCRLAKKRKVLEQLLDNVKNMLATKDTDVADKAKFMPDFYDGKGPKVDLVPNELDVEEVRARGEPKIPRPKACFRPSPVYAPGCEPKTASPKYLLVSATPNATPPNPLTPATGSHVIAGPVTIMATSTVTSVLNTMRAAKRVASVPVVSSAAKKPKMKEETEEEKRIVQEKRAKLLDNRIGGTPKKLESLNSPVTKSWRKTEGAARSSDPKQTDSKKKTKQSEAKTTNGKFGRNTDSFTSTTGRLVDINVADRYAGLYESRHEDLINALNEGLKEKQPVTRAYLQIKRIFNLMLQFLVNDNLTKSQGVVIEDFTDLCNSLHVLLAMMKDNHDNKEHAMLIMKQFPWVDLLITAWINWRMDTQNTRPKNEAIYLNLVGNEETKGLLEKMITMCEKWQGEFECRKIAEILKTDHKEYNGSAPVAREEFARKYGLEPIEYKEDNGEHSVAWPSLKDMQMMIKTDTTEIDEHGRRLKMLKTKHGGHESSQDGSSG